MGQGQVSPETIQKAAERYPGLPVGLAISRYILDEKAIEAVAEGLRAGSSWGGLHLETVGQMVQRLADRLYEERKRSVTLRITAEGWPFSYDHLELAVLEVDEGDEEGRDYEDPTEAKLRGCLCCCGDDHKVRDGGSQINLVQLRKLAEWPYLVAKNAFVPESQEYPLAMAVVCYRCREAKAEIRYAMAARPGPDGEAVYERVPLDQLKEPEVYWPDLHPDRRGTEDE